MLKHLRLALLATPLVFAPHWANAAYIDLTTFDTFAIGDASSSKLSNLATLTQATQVGDFFPAEANISSGSVQGVTSFDYSIVDAVGLPSRFYFNASSDIVDLNANTTFQTYNFATPYSGFLSFSLQGLSGFPAPASSATLLIKNVVGTAPLPVMAAVPEPETYAMLLAGLGVMGAVARRRRGGRGGSSGGLK